jgi:hypothetical protein
MAGAARAHHVARNALHGFVQSHAANIIRETGSDESIPEDDNGETI